MVWLRRALCLALVLVIWASTCSARVTEIVYVADLSSDSVYDELSLPAKGTGSALCRFDRRSVPHKVTIEVQHTIPTGAGGLPEITKIGVYRGAPGTPGSPVLFFSSFQSSRSLETFELNVSQQEANLEDFLDGLWFIQIHTIDNPKGEIRGQFLHNKRVYAQMDGTKMVPATRSGNYGLLTGTYSFEQPTDTLNLKIYHTVPNPTDLVVYQGEANANGKLIVGNELTTSPQSFSIKYAVRERDYLLDDHDYAVIESQSQTLGEIRGQITSIDYIERVDYTARLGSSGDLVGCGLVEYDCVTSYLEFNVHHNLEGNSTTFLVDTTGDSTVIASFSFLSSPSYGRVRLTDVQAANLDAEKIAFVIRSEANDDEINGFISTEYPYWSYISGTNVVPPVTTGASGCATIRLVKSGNTALIDYEIVHSVPNSRAERADINIGAEGYSSNELFEIFTSPDSPIKASDGIEISLTKATLATFQDEQMYLLVRSPSYPLGEIRGQIKLISPCLRDPIDQMSTKVDETTNYPTSYKFKYSGTLTTPPNTILSSSASLLRSPLSSSSSSLFSFVCALLFFCVAFRAVFTLH